MRFVTSSIYQKATRLALSEGLPPTLLEHHGERKEVAENAKYIPMELLLETYELAGRYLEPGFALRQGMQLKSDDYGTLGLSWKTCWLARDVLDRVVRYMVLVTNHGEARMEEEQGITRIYLLRDAKRKGLETANEAAFVMLTGILKEVTEKVIRPVKVQFKHASEEAPRFAKYFQCPVSFGQEENVLQFKTADIDIPTLKADRSLQKFLLERMEEEKEGVHVHADRLLREIHELIEEALPSGIPSIIQVAEYVGMSPRTLKRRLAEKDLSFRELVQKIQREVSVDLLRNSSRSIGEIAFQTGFSEQSAFNRAFKRWTGQSPAEYRKSA